MDIDLSCLGCPTHTTSTTRYAHTFEFRFKQQARSSPCQIQHSSSNSMNCATSSSSPPSKYVKGPGDGSHRDTARDAVAGGPASQRQEPSACWSLLVSGCGNATLRKTLSGRYEPSGQLNHDVPVYKKVEKTPNGLDAFLYMERDSGVVAQAIAEWLSSSADPTLAVGSLEAERTAEINRMREKATYPACAVHHLTRACAPQKLAVVRKYGKVRLFYCGNCFTTQSCEEMLPFQQFRHRQYAIGNMQYAMGNMLSIAMFSHC
jgi:hypothetical protein